MVGNVFNELLITIRKNQKGLNIVEYMVVLVIRIVSPCGMNLSRGADDLVYSSEGCWLPEILFCWASYPAKDIRMAIIVPTCSRSLSRLVNLYFVIACLVMYRHYTLLRCRGLANGCVKVLKIYYKIEFLVFLLVIFTFSCTKKMLPIL